MQLPRRVHLSVGASGCSFLSLRGGMVTVRAREAFNYAGIDRRSGESFEASVSDARILVLIGKVDECPSVFAPMTTSDVIVEDDAPRLRRTYRRKDVIPE